MSHTTWLQDHSVANNEMPSLIGELLKEKGKTCISIIVPTHRTGADRQMDWLEVEKAVVAARQAVQYEPKLLEAIDELVEMIDFDHNKEGIGLFVSRNIKKLIRFPFPVRKKIVVGKQFDLTDLLYIENYAENYYLLDISKKAIHLFHGMMDHLEEIKNDNFPYRINEEYEYNKPSQSSSYSGYAHVKGFEKDKSILQQLRLKKIFHEMDDRLIKYLGNKTIPLILCGTTTNIDLYKSVTGFSKNIIAIISDNFQYTGLHDQEIFAWLQLQSFVDDQKLRLIDDFKEKIGEGLGVYGIEETWRAATEGRGLKLLVEKDFVRTAYILENKLHFDLPATKFEIVPDIISETIYTVLEKKGKVIILEKDALKDHGHIALITRY